MKDKPITKRLAVIKVKLSKKIPLITLWSRKPAIAVGIKEKKTFTIKDLFFNITFQ